MWIGTKNGLNLYDGHTFMVFLPNNKNSISNENINDIAEDNKGRIWVATHQGLNLYDPNLHQWSKVEQTLNGDKLPNSIIWDIHIDEFQNLWIVSNVKNLISYNLNSQKINIFDWETYSASSFPEYKNLYRSIQKIAYKSKDEIWLGTNMGLCLLNIKQNKIEYIGGKKRVDMFDVIYLPEKNKVIFSTETNIVYVYDELSKTLKNMEIVRQSYPLNQLFNYDNNSAVSTLFGLGQWDNNFEKLFISEYIPNLSFSLRAGKVNSHYKDKYGNIWIGTSNGISILDIQSKTHFYPLNKCSDNESNNHMGDVIYDEISHTYIVTNPGEHRFYFYQTISGKIIEHINIEGEPIDNITGICKNKKNQIWLFSNLKAYLFNPHTLSFQRIRNINSNYQIRYMSQDFNGNIWVADYSGKIYLYDSLFKPLSTNISELNNGEKVILRILPDKLNNGVWFLSFERGISFFSFKNNKITTYDEFKNEQFSLITDISIDKQGIVWISTMKNGISYSYLKNGTIEFQHLSTSDGLPSNNFFNIQSLNLKNKINILLSSNGLKVWPKSNFYYHVPKFTSWGSDLLFTHQFLTTNKNNLLLGVAGGLLWIEPIYKDNNLKTNIISINNQYQFNIHEITKYNFKENNVSFKFSAFQYTKPNNGKYQYRLLNHDNNWNTTVNNSVDFRNLNEGQYEFQVRYVSDEFDSPFQLTSYHFEVMPPFYRSVWFLTICSIVVLGLLYILFNRIYSKLKIEQQVNDYASKIMNLNSLDKVVNSLLIALKLNTKKLNAIFWLHNGNQFEMKSLSSINTSLTENLDDVFNQLKLEFSNHQNKITLKSKNAFLLFLNEQIPRGMLQLHSKDKVISKNQIKLATKLLYLTEEKLGKYFIEEKLRSKIARDLHDEMGSSLSSIHIMTGMALKNTTNPEKILEKVNAQSIKMMESMSDIVWAINPNNDTVERLVLYMKEYASEIIEPLNIKYQFIIETTANQVQLNPEERKNIYLIFKETINNACKYSQATHINMNINLVKNELNFVIEDNGKGFKNISEHSGNGLLSMQARAKELNANLQIQSEIGKGTTINLNIKITSLQ